MDKLISLFRRPIHHSQDRHHSHLSNSRSRGALSAAAAAQLNAIQCPLLRLPAELRNQIWLEVLQVHSSHDAARLSRRDVLSTTPDTTSELDLGHLVPPPITRTCRAIRAETLAVLFAENVFVLRSTVVYRNNVACVGPSVHPRTAAWLTSPPVRPYTACIRRVVFFEPWAGTRGEVVGWLRYVDGKPRVEGVCGYWALRKQDIELILTHWGRPVVCRGGEMTPASEIEAIFMLADVLLTSPYEGIEQCQGKVRREEGSLDLSGGEERKLVFRRFWIQDT